MAYKDPAIRCRSCGATTFMSSSQLCDGCWGLRPMAIGGVRAVPVERRKGERRRPGVDELAALLMRRKCRDRRTVVQDSIRGLAERMSAAVNVNVEALARTMLAQIHAEGGRVEDYAIVYQRTVNGMQIAFCKKDSIG